MNKVTSLVVSLFLGAVIGIAASKLGAQPEPAFGLQAPSGCPSFPVYLLVTATPPAELPTPPDTVTPVPFTSTPTDTPAPLPTNTLTATETPTETATPTALPADTSTPTGTPPPPTPTPTPSATQTGTATLTPLPVPSSTTVAITQTHAILTWQDNSADETDFHIERSTGGAAWTEIGTVGENVTTYLDYGIVCGETYAYRVRAYRAADGQFSDYSNIAGGVTASCPPATPTGTPTPGPTPAAGWLGQYWNNITLSGTPVLTRVDPDINFTWNYGSPDPIVTVDQFSAQWTQDVSLSAASLACLTMDDGGLVLVDGSQVLTSWTNGGARQVCSGTPIPAGIHHVVVRYYEDGGRASVLLSWIPATPTGSGQ